MFPAGRHAEGHSAAVSEAVRAAARFDRRLVSVPAGAIAAVPVVAVLGVALALGHTVPAVTMGAGAMIVGIAWRASGGRPPLAVMATDTVVMGMATFVGCVTGSVTWLHIVVVCMLSGAGGLLVGVGNRGGVVGMQAIIAAVVFGRFSEPAPQALGLAALVMAGGAAQVAFLSVVRWPTPLRSQRMATAAAFHALAQLAGAAGEHSTLPAATALDEAAASLAAPTLFGDPALLTLRSLVSEGYRLRIQLSAIQLLVQRQPGDSPAATAVLKRAASVLGDAAGAITGDRDAARRLDDEKAQPIYEASDPPDGALERRLAAIAGQLRAVRALAPVAGRGGGVLRRRPQRSARTDRVQAVRAAIEQLKADRSLRSPVGRHAVRLAVVVPVAITVARVLPLDRGYWVPVSAATVLRPEFGATFTRGTERALGTLLGVGIAGGLAAALHPGSAVEVALIGLLAWAGYATMPASFAAGFAFITALVVLLLDILVPNTFALASARLLDTVVGGAIGLLAYALWPTWARGSAWSGLADLVSAQREYIDAVLGALARGSTPRESQARELARAARLARTRAEATIGRSLSEPATRRIEADTSSATLGASRRLAQAAHALRLDAPAIPRRPRPGLERAADDVHRLLRLVEGQLRARVNPRPPASAIPQLRARVDQMPPASAIPDLRASYASLVRACSDDDQLLLEELDELVDAANGLAAATGLDVDVGADSDTNP